MPKTKKVVESTQATKNKESATQKAVIIPQKAKLDKVNKIDKKRVFDNKLSVNLIDIDNNKVKLFKQVVNDMLKSVAEFNKDTTKLTIYIDNEFKDIVKTRLVDLTGIDKEQISNNMLGRAIISAMTYKMLSNKERDGKEARWAYSASAFIKAINASIVKTISKKEIE